MPPSLHGDWSPRNRHLLESLLADPGQGGYAVFDWDNTCVYLDVEEATVAFQVDRLAFAATPDEMQDALGRGLPKDKEVAQHLDRLDQAYRWLWPRYNHLLGRGDYDEVAGSPAHLDFRARYIALYTLLEHRYGPEVAYPWLPFRFTGMTAQQVRNVAAQAVRWQLELPIGPVHWQSAELCVTWRGGLRLLPEISSLQRALQSAGVDVWVCTASFVEGIREIASSEEFGYGLPPERVIGLQLETDEQGRYLPLRKAGSEVTYARGKTEAVQRLLESRYGCGPLLVAGDSDGDAPMMSYSKDTRVGLIIDTDRPAESAIGKLATLAKQGDPRYLLQRRNDTLGCWQA